MDDPHAQPVHELTNDLDLEILDLLCKEAHSAQRLTETLSQGDEQVGVDAVRGHLEGLASHGLARPSEEAAHHADEAEADELVIAEKRTSGGRSPRRAAR
jgi:repressor of nif and glnA expression